MTIWHTVTFPVDEQESPFTDVPYPRCEEEPAFERWELVG